MMNLRFMARVTTYAMTLALLGLVLGMVPPIWSAAEPSPIDRPFLHDLFADHMVLQREVKCPVWGWTQPGQKVTVAMAGTQASAVADAEGAWMVRIGPFPAGGPHTLTVTGPQQATLTDVMVGDVWICSGQSNMQMGIKGVNQWWNEIGPTAEMPGVRLASLYRRSAFVPPNTVATRWRVSINGAAGSDDPDYGGFSAIGFLFGRQIHRATGVPIGLIQSCWGATGIQAWSTPASLARQPEHLDPDLRQVFGKKIDAAWREIDPAYETTRTWSTLDFDASSWQNVDLPQGWPAGTEGKDFQGVVWFRKEVALPAEWAGHELQVGLGPISDFDTVWCNGAFIGADNSDGNGLQPPRFYRVPAGPGTPGRAVIAVRLIGGRFLGKPEEMSLRVVGLQSAPLPLAGRWSYCTSTPSAKLKGQPPSRRDVPGGCYMGMIRPLAPFAIKGVIWYQGEGNAGDPIYRQRLTDMITDWRSLFGVGDFPFYIVQIAGFGRQPEQPAGSSWALTREHQFQVAQSVPNCGLAVSIDRGEIYDIHPPNKQDVGKRLALVALAKTYGQKIEYEGPTYDKITVEGSAIRLSFAHAKGGLISLGAGPTGFEIAGSDLKFVWAQALIDGETVVVSSPAVPKPTAVRYGWSDNPLCNLYNRADLPAPPFRTDTDPKR